MKTLKIYITLFLLVSLSFPPLPLVADDCSRSQPVTEEVEERDTSETNAKEGQEKKTKAPEMSETKTNDGDSEAPEEETDGQEDEFDEQNGENEGEEEPETEQTIKESSSPPDDPPSDKRINLPPENANDNSVEGNMPENEKDDEPPLLIRSSAETEKKETEEVRREEDASPEPPEVILHEIQIAGERASDEFIELHNPSDEDVSLAGWRLCRRTSGSGVSSIKSFSGSDMIPGGGFYLFAHSEGRFAGFADARTKSSPLAKNNAVALTDDCEEPATILDSVAWGSGTAFDETVPRTDNPPPGSSLVQDPETGVWSISEKPSPTNSDGETYEKPEPEPDPDPKPTPDLPSPETIIINELYPNPIDESDEWIELFNTSQETIPLAGWILADAAKEYALPPETSIGERGFLVIPKSESKIALNNGSETVTLVMPDSVVSDSFEYMKTKEGSSWARNETGNFELTDILTPGEANRFPVVEELFIAPLPPDGSIHINEVFANPETRGEADEWIELANTSRADISLAGFILRDASKYGKYVLGDAVAIGAGSFLVLPRNNTKISLNNGSETVTLLHGDDKTVITTLSYDRTVEGASYGYFKNGRYRFSKKETPGAKNRFGKEPKIENYDIPKKGYRDVPVAFSAEGSEDDMKYVWNFGDEHQSYKQETTHRYEKTGTYYGTLTVRGDIEEVVKTFTIRIEKYPKHDLRIVALLPNPDGRDTDFEWIRIENQEKKAVDLTGWIIASGTASEKLVNHKILTEDLRVGGSESITLTREDSRFTLPNKRAVIELRRPDGSRADRITYDRPDGIDEEELLMVADDGTLVWIAPAPETGTSTTSVSRSSEEPDDPFLRGKTTHPTLFTFARFLALGTPFRLALPDAAPRVLGLSDTRFENKPKIENQKLPWFESIFQTLNSAMESFFR